MKRSYGELFGERNNYLINLFGDETNSRKEIQKVKEEVDFDLEKIYNINKYYKQINESIIILNEVENKIIDQRPEIIYYDLLENIAIEIWK
jgi:hypothetical protein